MTIKILYFLYYWSQGQSARNKCNARFVISVAKKVLINFDMTLRLRSLKLNLSNVQPAMRRTLQTLIIITCKECVLDKHERIST